MAFLCFRFVANKNKKILFFLLTFRKDILIICDMPKRNGPIHVAKFVRRYNGKTYESYLLRRTFRQDGKVKHETLGNISHLPLSIIDMIRAALRGEAYAPAHKAFTILRSLPHGHVAAVLGTLRKLKLEEVISSLPCAERDMVVAMIVARVIHPCSKLATARLLNAQTSACSLGQVLGMENIAEEDFYGAMDWLIKRQRRIESKLANKHLSEGSLVLYDITSSYYTGSHCSLAKFGHDRDGKGRFPQIVYGLLCNGEGCPVAVEVFEGNTADAQTLGAQIGKIRQRFGLERVILVGDRGMITSARIREDFKGKEGLDWITALRAPEIHKLVEQGAVQPSLFDQRNLMEITSPDYPGERLIVCRNPFLAEERARTREELLSATERRLAAIAAATQRQKRPLRGQDKIGLRVGKVIDRYNVAKHFCLTITDNSFSYQRDEEKIAAEARLDGVYIIRTSVTETVMPSDAVVRAYKGLSKVEQAFRCLKTVDLKIRPIYHHLEERVRAHVFLCMLAYYVEWHMRRALAPMLFEEEGEADVQGLHFSAEALARRKPAARQKAAGKRTAEGMTVHSFQTLLADLATIAKNRVRASGAENADFHVITELTPLQRRVFDLLGVAVNL